MALIWDAVAVRTGVPELDAQYRVLIWRLDHLFDVLRQQGSLPELSHLVDETIAYASWHFEREDRGLRRHCCAEAVCRQSHVRFLSTLSWLRERIRVEGGRGSAVLEAQRHLAGWFREHSERVADHRRRCVRPGGRPQQGVGPVPERVIAIHGRTIAPQWHRRQGGGPPRLQLFSLLPAPEARADARASLLASGAFRSVRAPG